MLIAVDAGNTNTTFGLFRIGVQSPVRTWRASSVRERTTDEWAALLGIWLSCEAVEPSSITGLVLATVSPAIGAAIEPLGQRLFGCSTLTIRADLDLGIAIAVDAPSDVGADRLVNAAEAFHRFGGPVIVVDMGTATKIEAIDASGAFLGGVIAPGLGVSMESLTAKAARLFAVQVALPDHAIGTNTIHAVQSGVVAGHLAMIEGMVARVRHELGGADHVVLTGGFSGAVAGGSPLFTDILPDLTLEGLAALYSRNTP